MKFFPFPLNPKWMTGSNSTLTCKCSALRVLPRVQQPPAVVSESIRMVPELDPTWGYYAGWIDKREFLKEHTHFSSEHTSWDQRKSVLLWKLPMRGGRIRIGLCRWRCQWGPPTPTPTRTCPLFRPPLFLHLQNQKLTRRLRHSHFYGSELNLQQIYRGFIISFSVYRLEDVILDPILLLGNNFQFRLHYFHYSFCCGILLNFCSIYCI